MDESEMVDAKEEILNLYQVYNDVYSNNSESED